MTVQVHGVKKAVVANANPMAVIGVEDLETAV